jgi:YggT family protein
MGLLGSLLGLVLLLFLLMLIARALLDWVGVLSSRSSRSSESSGEGVLKAREVTYRLTEPVIAPVRRVLKPVNLGGVQFDLAFTVVFIATLILRSVVTSL